MKVFPVGSHRLIHLAALACAMPYVGDTASAQCPPGSTALRIEYQGGSALSNGASVALPQFNPALGHGLVEAQIMLSADVDVGARAINLSTTGACSGATTTTDETVTVNMPVRPSPALLHVQDIVVLPAIGPGGSASAEQVAGASQRLVITDPVALAALTGVGTIEFWIFATASDSGNSTCGDLYLAVVHHPSRFRVEITYVYCSLLPGADLTSSLVSQKAPSRSVEMDRAVFSDCASAIASMRCGLSSSASHRRCLG
jgi:hypothetical protein